MSGAKKGEAPRRICNERYNVLPSLLGQGGWGKVYQGIRLDDGMFVAVKVVQLERVPKDLVEGIMNEVAYLKYLDHPRIVKYLDSERTKTDFFIVLELVESGNLADLARIGRLPEPLIARYMRQVLEGLDYLHSQGVIHADIKGANVLLTKEGAVKLADFGIAKRSVGADDVPDGGPSVLGSPYWMAPEIVSLMGASTKADVWSLGCTVVELLDGHPPYYDLPPMTAMFRIAQDDTPPLPEGISSLCRDFLLLCFQKEPQLRSSATDLIGHAWITKSITKGTDGPSSAKEIVEKFQTLRKDRRRMLERTLSRVSVRNSERHKSHQKTQTEVPGKARLSGLFPSGPGDATVHSTPTERSRGSEARTRRIAKSKTEKLDEASPHAVEKAASTALEALKSPRTGKLRRNKVDWFNEKVVDHIKEVKRVYKPSAHADSADLYEPEKNLALFADSETSDSWSDLDDSGPDGHLSLPDLRDKVAALSGSKRPDASPRMHTLELPTERYEEVDTSWGFDEEETSEMSDLNRSSLQPSEGATEGAVGKHRSKELSELRSQISADILSAMRSLDPSLSATELQNSLSALFLLVDLYPDQKVHLYREHGAMPLLELLERFRESSVEVAPVLELVVKVLDGSPEYQESFSVLGGISAVFALTARPARSSALMAQIAHFIQSAMFANVMTLKMFLACQTLALLTDFLTQAQAELQDTAVAVLDRLLHEEHAGLAVSKTDICRLLVGRGAMRSLVRLITFRPAVARLLFTFSKADPSVLTHFNTDAMRGIVDALRTKDADTQVLLLKILRNLSEMRDKSTAPFTEADAVRALVEVLGALPSKSAMLQQHLIFNTLNNLCSLDVKARERAAAAGVVAHIRRIVVAAAAAKQRATAAETKEPIEYALPILFDMMRTKSLLSTLYKHNVSRLFPAIFTLGYPYTVQAVESLTAWLSLDKKEVITALTAPEFIAALVALFRDSEYDMFVTVLESYGRLIGTSHRLCQALVADGFMDAVLGRLKRVQNVACRVQLLKIIDELYRAHRKKKKFVSEHELLLALEPLTKDDAVLVRELATTLRHSLRKAK